MKKYLVFAAAFLFPALTFAQGRQGGGFSSLQDTLGTLTNFINALIPFAIGIAVLVFIFGLISFITAGADEEKRKGARNTIIWGIIILFVMVSVWGLVNVLRNTFSLDNQVPDDIPAVPRPSGGSR
jgi:hypothetical protein